MGDFLLHGNYGRFEKYDIMVFQTADPFENTNNCRNFTWWLRFEIPSLNNNSNAWLWVSDIHGGGGGRGAARWRIPAVANELCWCWRGLSTLPNVAKIITYTSHAQTSSPTPCLDTSGHQLYENICETSTTDHEEQQVSQDLILQKMMKSLPKMPWSVKKTGHIACKVCYNPPMANHKIVQSNNVLDKTSKWGQ